jgi:NADPH-dependent ferric siderophore reductase
VTVRLVERIRSKLAVEQAQVVAVDHCGASMVRVRVRFDGPVEGGAHFALAVGGSGALVSSVWRRFTVSDVAEDASSFAWLAFASGDRPAAAWHRQVRPGDTVSFRSFDRPTRPPVAPAIWVGDETAIGSFTAFAAVGVAPARVVLWTNEMRDAFVPGVNPDLVDHVPSARAAAEQLGRTMASEPGTRVHVAGSRDLVMAVRSAVGETGLARTMLSVRTYWAPGKRGME